ncbi:MAG: choice-of-anchor C family protein [Phycisphaerae bacterium]
MILASTHLRHLGHVGHRVTSFAAAACLLAATGVASAQNLVLNGSFEDGPPTGWFSTYGVGSLVMPHWRVTGSSIDHIGSYWNAASGFRCVDLNGGEAGGVAQTIATAPGVIYVVTFSLAANPDCGPAVKTMKVRANAAVSDDFSFDGTGTSRGDMRWSVRQWQFVATDAVTEIELFSALSGPCGPAIDDVVVEACIGGAVSPLVTACRGSAVPIEALIAGNPPLTIRWQIEDASSVDGWSDLVDGALVIGGIEWGLVAGTSDTTLTVTPDATGSVALPQIRVRARISNDCSTLATRPTTVSVCQCLECPADFNQDGGIDGGDINAFFAAWESGICDGDVNADGGVDSGDINTFFIAWEAGGC